MAKKTTTPEITEAQALTFWREWMQVHPEHKSMITANLNAIVYNVKMTFDLTHGMKHEGHQGLGEGSAALILYRLFEKGFLPMKEGEPE
jgi:hypothetical protein